MRAEDRKKILAPASEFKRIRPFSYQSILLVSFAAVSAIFAGTIFNHIGMGSPWFVVVAVVILIVLSAMIRSNQKKSDILETHETWLKTDPIFGLLVTSDSPKWKARIDDLWVPQFGSDVIILNWSQRHIWPKSMEAKIFEISTGRTEFCPVLIVPREHGVFEVFRFFWAFKAAKHGNLETLSQLEDLIFQEFKKWQDVHASS